jgi:tRNA uridine 5-carboxymethylaminomethyl modification enzyme
MVTYDVIVIGAGHAGIEASLAASRMGCTTLLVTLRRDTIGMMSCNPAIGGVGKGQLVKEIDALGGQMGIAADTCGIQFRMLNASKGPAVQSSRAQVDMFAYQKYMQEVVERQEALVLLEGEVKRLISDDGIVKGVLTAAGDEIRGRTVIICTGTFLDGTIHVGLKSFPGGRMQEPAAVGLADDLKALGFSLLRFKTGTCPRLDKKSIDFSRLIIQEGDNPPHPFSFSTKALPQKQVPCYITYTNKRTHQIILDNLDQSPLYAGIIKATGVRYCPSVEDKIVKFHDKERHQVFLEPQGYESDEIYPNGLSTSLPEEVQLKILHSIEGLEEARVLRFGYGIEHTISDPTQLFPTLETKPIQNLYIAGQMNGTTGYEEAAAQGFVAGVNAALRVQGKEPLVFDRSNSYIGVLIDDLTTKGTSEPYRMFTSRVEYRLLIREDNADIRLGDTGYKLGLLPRDVYEFTKKKQDEIQKGIAYLKKTRLKPTEEVNQLLLTRGTPILKKTVTLEELLKRPQVNMQDIVSLFSAFPIPDFALPQVEIEVKYAGFIQRQIKEVERFRNLEKIKVPADMDYLQVFSLSREIREKLMRFRPLTLGQASRISGVTPAAVALLMVYLRKWRHEQTD